MAIISAIQMILCSKCFFFNDTATTEIYTLSLHDALPIFLQPAKAVCDAGRWNPAARCKWDGGPTSHPRGTRHGDRKDRKSTRLNSSHANISYAVFCLKKNKQTLLVYVLHFRTFLYFTILH